MSLKVVIIGAVAAGPKAGCRIKRLDPSAQVTMLDRDQYISYGGCGIPFYVSGDVADLSGLLSTSFHMVRDAPFFRGAKGMEVLPGTEAIGIDRAAKLVHARDLASGRELELPYDKLVIATGSRPFVPPVPGADLEGVLPVADLHQAQTIKDLVAQGSVGAAAVVGAGATGLEMAEALADLWGIEVHVIEMAGQILPGAADPEMAVMMQTHLARQDDLHLHLGARLERIGDNGQGGVGSVTVDGQEIPVDLVIMATGVRPNVDLARAAGLELAGNGAIKVDPQMRTSDPDIYAGGDCVALPCMLTGRERYMPAGSLANRMGRVIGSNVCGAQDEFPGVLGSFCIKLFGLSLARTGLDEAQAAQAGLDCVAPLVVQADRAHFHPDQKLMYVKLVVEKSTRRLLGLSALGENGDAVVGRVNALAGMLPWGARLEHLANLELAYSPPLGAALDILNAAANTAENLIAGKLRPMTPAEFSRRLAAGPEDDTLFLDMRALDNAAPYLKQLSPRWVHLPQETLAQRLAEVPGDRDLVLICNSGVRSYEAQCLLNQHGLTNTFNLSGGVAAVKASGDPILKSEDPSQD